MGFSSQEYWSGLPCPPSGVTPGIEPTFSALTDGFFTSAPPRKLRSPGVVTEFLKVVLKLLLKGTSTAFVGDFANFVVGCAFVLPASIIYHRRKTRKTAIVGMIVGTLCMTVFGSAFNAYYLIPKFSQLFGLPLEAIVGMGTAVNSAINSVGTLVMYAVVPFNILKGIVDSVLTYLLYKRIEPVLFPETRK